MTDHPAPAGKRPALRLRTARRTGSGPVPAVAREGVVKRSIAIAGHATSISLEDPFWRALRLMAREQGISLAALVALIDGRRARTNLSSALRVHVLDHAQAQIRSLRGTPVAETDSAVSDQSEDNA
jgi:predicted DNA-binding ribbon-helix-helix protein